MPFSAITIFQIVKRLLSIISFRCENTVLEVKRGAKVARLKRKENQKVIMEGNFAEDQNFTNETAPDDFTEDDNDYDALFVVSWILVVCGVIENVIICWILIRKKKCFKNFSNFHLLNLAITDILFRAVSIPDLLPGELSGGSNFTCKVIDFGRYTTLAVTFALLAGIAFDRYIHIVHPFKARRVTWKHSRNVIVLKWIYGALCSAPFLYSTEWVVHVDEETFETFGNCEDKHGLSFQISVTIYLGCSFIIPLVFMGVVYSRIVCVLWSRAHKKMINKNIAKVKIRVVKMMVLIVVTYFITWGPKLILKTMETFLFEKVTSEEDENEGSAGDIETDAAVVALLLLEPIFVTFSLGSSILNPLIFGYYNRSFREDLKTIFFGITRAKCFIIRKNNYKVASSLVIIPLSTGINMTNITMEDNTQL